MKFPYFGIKMMRLFILCWGLLWLISSVPTAQSEPESSEADIYTDVEFFQAICAQKSVIWIKADLDLREEHWPKDCRAPVILQNNMTISGPLDKPLYYTVSFNFMARKVVIKPYGEVRLRHFTARNTRRGGGGEIDFIAFSPRGILWTDDLNKNQIICLHTDPNKLLVLPLPVNFSQFANRTQMVQLWPTYCTPRQCWNEVLHYDQFFTDVNVGSDSETGGYVMAKNNASKTCDEFVTDECLVSKGGDTCMAAVINDFLDNLSHNDDNRKRLAIALSVGLGVGVVLLAAISVVVLIIRRRRIASAAAAAQSKLCSKGADLESGSDGDGDVSTTEDGKPGRQRHADIRGSSKEIDRGSSSKDAASSTSDDPVHVTGPKMAVAVVAAPAVDSVGVREAAPSAGLQGEEARNNIEDSFRFETGDDMGRCLSAGRRGLNTSSSPSSACSGAALVEGVMEDGSVCTIAVGSPLGQGSYGLVFKGLWQDKDVAVKLILCDSSCSEQVAMEVRLMTSESCRHANLLRAYTYTTRARVINRQHPAGQALQSTIRTLASSSCRHRNPLSRPEGDLQQQMMMGAGPGQDSGKSSGGANAELAETWIVSEYCDHGALAHHVHHAKRFSFPPDIPPPGATAQPGMAGGCEGSPNAAGTGASTTWRRPRLSLILSVLRDIAAGMKHLHSLNIVHGDLKLANVLLSSRPSYEGPGFGAGAGACEAVSGSEPGSGPNPATATATATISSPSSSPSLTASGALSQLPSELVAKVADFGLSRWLKEGQTHHSTKTVGTVTHMPPELLRSGKLTLSGDVYSFGIIMWEVLTGSVPYKGLMYGEVVERVVVSQRRPEFPQYTPHEYRSLAERCWASDAAARPTFAGVLDDLEAMLARAACLQAESDMLFTTMLPQMPAA